MTERDRIALAENVLRLEAECITDLIPRLGPDFDRAVGMILACRGRTVVTGIGKSGLIGRKIAATLASTGTPSLFLHPSEGIHGDLGMVGRGDLVVAISNSGESDEIVRILPVLKRLEIAVIAVVGSRQSTLASAADVVLDAGVKEEACPLGLAPTSSTTAVLALGDALAVVLLTERGFREEDFALFHPGGTLGRRLVLSVEDVMHPREGLPVVHGNTPMCDVVVRISSGRLGVTAVVDADDIVQGIVTDGDLRRGVERSGKDLFQLTAGDIMSQSPKTAKRSELAAAALARMERHAITALLVVDDAGRLDGLVHLHDLLKAGLA